MLASRKSKSVCLVCNGTGLLTKTKKSKSRHNPADLCPNCVGSGSLRNNPEGVKSAGLSKNAVIGLSVLGVLSLGGLALFLARKKDAEKIEPVPTNNEVVTSEGDVNPERTPTSDTPTSDTPTPKPALKAGDVLISSPQGVEMVFCPKGDFTMGHVDEAATNPPRLEKIEKSFLLGKTEVTQDLYQKVIGTNPSRFKGDGKNPVESVSWEDAIKFCNKLSELEGLQLCYTKNSIDAFDWSCDFDKNGYRLPTEKEWEYAAKAGTQNKWAGTDAKSELEKYAWYIKNAGDKTHPVGTLSPNEWGLYDMSGNVDEWCWDKFTPANTEPSTSRVYRGGGYYEGAPYFNSASRIGSSPGGRLYDLGFRVCRTFVQ
jgi:sulfatase modifying factor 1